MTPTTLETLFRMRREDISFGGDVYALNVRLKLKPWMPPAVEVWAYPDDPPDYANVDDWREVREILETLYDEYRRREKRD